MINSIKVVFFSSTEVSNYIPFKVSMTLLRIQNEHMTNVNLTHEWENRQDSEIAFEELSIYGPWRQNSSLKLPG